MEKIYVSTVTPVYRGAEYLRDLVGALASVQQELRDSGMPVELVESIFVDDSAVDSSVEVLTSLQREHPWIRIVNLSRNFGQHGATVAGILHSSGDWVATLDEDLQHHPKHLVRLLLHAVAGERDIVYAAPERKVHLSPFRNFSSRGFKAFVSWLTGDSIARRFSSFRMVRGSVVRAACSVSTHDTYFDVVLNWFTNRVDSVVIPMLDVRSAAESGYSLKKLLLHARKLLISSQIRPLRIAAGIGFVVLVTSMLLSVATLLMKFLRPELIELRGWTSLMLTIAFFGGLTSMLIGIALEYMSTLVLHTLGKPSFFVVDRSKDRLLKPFLSSTAAG